MKRLGILLVIFLASILASGCGNIANNQIANPPGNTQTVPNAAVEVMPGEYYPLTVGSSWEYEGTGNEFASFTRKVLFSKGNLSQTTESNGGTTATSIYKTTDTTVTRVYYAGEDYQPKNLLDTTYSINDNEIVLQSPMKVGTTWPNKNTNKTILALNEVVDTPAGKFEDCVKVKITDNNDTTYQYYKKGVGLVKQEYISGTTTITSTLKKYEIK